MITQQLAPEIRDHDVYPTIPAEDLACAGEPALGFVTKETEFGQWAEALRQAGADCRAKLELLRNLVNGWPKP